MNEPKPFASLTGSILARKGRARPAMRPQTAPLHYDAPYAARALEEDLGWNDMGDLNDMVDFSDPDETVNFSARGGMLDLSKLSSMTADDPANAANVTLDRADGHQAPEGEGLDEAIQTVQAQVVSLPPNATPPLAERPEVLRQQEEIIKRINAPSRKRGNRRSAVAEGRRAAFTLRLDAERHLKLRLASTLLGKSAQNLVTEALDKWLSELPEVADLAAKVGEGRR